MVVGRAATLRRSLKNRISLAASRQRSAFHLSYTDCIIVGGIIVGAAELGDSPVLFLLLEVEVEVGEEALLEALPIELGQGDVHVQVAKAGRQRLFHQWVVMRTYKRQDGAFDQVSVDRPLAENVKLVEAALDAAVHVDLDHG